MASRAGHDTSYWTELDFVEMQESPVSPFDIDFTSHVFPPTPGVDRPTSNSTHRVFTFGEPQEMLMVVG